MLIHGFQTLTLVDFPERVAAILFTGCCDFRCPYCQNASLVLHPELEGVYSDEEVFTYLRKRRHMLDGVVMSGGEPTLHKDLPDYLSRIKDLGLEVKLDSNGNRPEVLRNLVEKGLVDYIAMDVKNSLPKYPMTVGLRSMDTSAIRESIGYLLTRPVEYEFRTTVVHEFHDEESFISIADLCAGADAYYLQCFVASGHTIAQGLTPPSPDDLERYRVILSSTIGNVQIRDR